jgi:hypothetical protein
VSPFEIGRLGSETTNIRLRRCNISLARKAIDLHYGKAAFPVGRLSVPSEMTMIDNRLAPYGAFTCNS